MKRLLENWNGFLQEHRGEPCSKKPAKERLECEKNSKELEKQRIKRRKQKEDTFPGKAPMDALGRGIVEKKKQQCTPGNKNHDTDGKFSSVSSSRSWSDRNPGGKSNCESGQYRKKGTNKKTWTKIKCGRGEGGKGKAKVKCKDGSKAYQEALGSPTDDSWVKIKKSALDLMIQQINDPEMTDSLLVEPIEEGDMTYKDGKNTHVSKEQIKTYCNQRGYNNIEQWLNRMNAIELSQKGELNKQNK
jgi:hypothetical protein